jgi:hypothetical protein
MRRPELARGALLLLCGYCLFIGFVAVAAPHTFYADFPSSPTGSTSCRHTTGT